MKKVILLIISLSFFISGNSFASGHKKVDVTITNITSTQIFTPLLVASHNKHLSLFTLGEAASSELETIAESGNNAPLADALIASGNALDVATHNNVLLPGQSVTLTVNTSRHNRYISVAAMLVPTNDAFVAINGVYYKGKKSRTIYAPAYDAGTEDNDELCVSIPGPPFICAGEGVSASGGEGFVHIHNGIHGTGDLTASASDWKNPVAKITIKRH